MCNIQISYCYALIYLFKSHCAHITFVFQMMWAADFDEAVAQQLEGNCLEPLVLHLPEDLNAEMKAESTGNGKVNIKGTGSEDGDHDPCPSYSNGVKSVSSHPLCGLTRANFWARQDQLHISTIAAPTRNGDDDMPVFCVAAILIINRHKIMRQTHSIDDVIKAGLFSVTPFLF